MSRRAWIFWAVASGLGAAVLALPDAGPRLFSISRTHGPSAVDAAGIVLVLAGWSVLWTSLWRRRSSLPSSRPVRVLAFALAVAATALLVWSVAGDHGWWWMLGVAVLAGLQLAAAVSVTVRPRRPAP